MDDAPLRLTELDDARAAWLALLPGPVAPCRLPVGEAVGRVLAEPVIAAGPVPPVVTALAAGWALAAAETMGAGPYAPVPLAAAPAWVRPGEALPPGTDAVLPGFAVDRDGPFAQVLDAVAPGEGVRQPGADIAAGTVLRAVGEALRPQDLPALAALDVREVAVRIPRLAMVADPLMPALAALATTEGAALQECAATPDLVLLRHDPGGLSVRGLGARPGMTVGFGRVDGRPALLLPDPVEEALAAWFLLARPAIATLAGRGTAPPETARLARKVASAVGLAEIVPLRRDAEGGAEPLAIGALPLAALAAADALLVVPASSEGYEAGTTIPIIVL